MVNGKIILVFFVISVNADLRIYMTGYPLQRIGGRIYNKELLSDQFSSPKELAYDSSSRNLFFMYMDDLLQNSGRAFINILTKEATKIKGIVKNKATVVDTESGDVFFGSEDGLYRFDPLTNQANNIGLYNMNIMKLVVKNNAMYLLDANNHMIYKVFNGGKEAVKLIDMKTIMEFDVDFQNNVHFVNMCGVYCVMDGHVVKNKDLTVAYNFLTDDGKTFALSDDGLYEVHCWNGTATKVAQLDFNPRSIAFGDYGDIFYTEDDNIYRLKPVTSYVVYKIHKNKSTT